MKVKPYLILGGNAEKVAQCYAEILGGRIENLTRYGDCMHETPQEYKSKVAHLCLMLGDTSIGMADSEPNKPATLGTGNIITIVGDSEEQIKSIYERLSEGGEIRCPLQSTFFARQYADFVDRYGVAWSLIFE